MSSTAKVIVTLGIIVGFFILFGILVAARKNSGAATPGLFGLILAGGAWAGIRAVWKKPSGEVTKKQDSSSNDIHLDKNS